MLKQLIKSVPGVKAFIEWRRRRFSIDSRRRRDEARAGTPEFAVKYAIARAFLQGEGLEIGAFDNPLPTSDEANVVYLDRYTTRELRRMYPDADVMPVDVVGEGQTLDAIADASRDFVIANNVIEHYEDPIRAIQNMLRVTRPGGVLYLIIPDKRYTFDQPRQRTPFAHLLDDYRRGPEISRRAHFEEWVRLIDKIEEPRAAAEMVEHLMSKRWPIHYHVWTAADILEMFQEMRKLPGFDFEIEAFYDGQFEVTVVLRRGDASPGSVIPPSASER